MFLQHLGTTLPITIPPHHRTTAPPHHRTTVPPYHRTTVPTTTIINVMDDPVIAADGVTYDRA
eukprot:CAMPEP_0119474550 /NCGR_PEP_ID=MMETSP1344-20130328/5767_1 /TAXON_ID=236787 /ORGANISM="Florenciella parvula, Strain CCMP2471" /LENGTH=62 /DNA_ID=CAMNT_0007507873 /DNA_START=483 /DNA_END=669 /DNA_ORIENTATION=+